MTAFPNSPRLVRGGIVLIDVDSGAVKRVIALQYNPDTLTRTLQVQAFSGDSSDRSEAMRIKGPPVETLKLDAEIDATDALELPDQNADTLQFGIAPQIAVLEALVNPSVAELQALAELSAQGTLEIVPPEAPLVLFVWGAARVVPVRVTDFSVTEEAFDPNLNPIRAKVSLGMRVLSANDLGFDNKGGSLFMVHHQQKERFAQMANGAIAALGLAGVP